MIVTDIVRRVHDHADPPSGVRPAAAGEGAGAKAVVLDGLAGLVGHAWLTGMAAGAAGTDSARLAAGWATVQAGLGWDAAGEWATS
jgi:hypothetical protein